MHFLIYGGLSRNPAGMRAVSHLLLRPILLSSTTLLSNPQAFLYFFNYSFFFVVELILHNEMFVETYQKVEFSMVYNK